MNANGYYMQLKWRLDGSHKTCCRNKACYDGRTIGLLSPAVKADEQSVYIQSVVPGYTSLYATINNKFKIHELQFVTMLKVGKFVSSQI